MAEKSKSTKKNYYGSQTRKSSKKPQKPSIIVIVLIAIGIYALYSIFIGLVNRLETETAQMITISDTVSTVGVAVRNETIITSDVRGVTVGTVENGGKVFKGETVVNVFDTEVGAQAYRRIREIEDALAEFESMRNAGEENASEISAIEKQTDNRLLALSSSIYNGDIPEALELSEDILYIINKGQIATKLVENFDARIKELEEEKDQLISLYGDEPNSLRSPLSGYYIREVDGYESLLNTSILENLTPESLDRIMAEHVEINDPAIIGKIADDYVWNIVCTVTSEEAEKFEADKFYTIHLPYSDSDSIDARLVRINLGENGENSLLVFKCTNMVSDLASFRTQPIVIQVKKFSGLAVSESAIITKPVVKDENDEDVVASDSDVAEPTEVTGVYILWGNEVKFRRIQEIYRDGDTVVCTVKSDRGWLKMYDDVLIDTEDLYDGKIVNAS